MKQMQSVSTMTRKCKNVCDATATGANGKCWNIRINSGECIGSGEGEVKYDNEWSRPRAKKLHNRKMRMIKEEAAENRSRHIVTKLQTTERGLSVQCVHERLTF